MKVAFVHIVLSRVRLTWAILFFSNVASTSNALSLLPEPKAYDKTLHDLLTIKKTKQAFSVFPFSVEDFFYAILRQCHCHSAQSYPPKSPSVCFGHMQRIIPSNNSEHQAGALQPAAARFITATDPHTPTSETSVIILLYRRREWAIEMFSDIGGVGQFSDHQPCAVASAQFLPKAGETCLSPRLERYRCNSFP